MVKTEVSKSPHPDCIILENKTVVPWEESTAEMKEQFLQESRPDHGSNGLPDKGNGKAQRNKQRRSRHHS